MTKCIRMFAWLSLALGISFARPASATAERIPSGAVPARALSAYDEVTIICYYMGEVRDSYGGTGSMWYCEAWGGNEWRGSYTEVVRHES